MPWIGLLSDGTKVTPEEVSDGKRVYCPNCRTKMYPRGPMSDGRARHFVHLVDAMGGCSGAVNGESEIHKKRKSLVLSALNQYYSDTIDRCDLEVTLKVSNTASPVDRRRADVLVEFTKSDELLGHGLIVEVQHKNADKSIESVTHDYLEKGYSVYWADADDFETDRFLVEMMVECFRSPPGREKAVTPSRWSPMDFAADPIDPRESSIPDSIEQVGSRPSLADGNTESSDRWEIPPEDEFGHPVPLTAKCDHFFQQTDRVSTYRCEDCQTTAYWREGDLYIPVLTSGLQIRHGSTHNVDCGACWRLDLTEQKYICVGCGKRYPADRTELLESLGIPPHQQTELRDWTHSGNRN